VKVEIESHGDEIFAWVGLLIGTTFPTQIKALLAAAFTLIAEQGKASLMTDATHDLVWAGFDAILEAAVTRSKAQGFNLIDNVMKVIVDYGLTNILKGVLMDY
jgi:hypothetical protein